MGAQPGRVPAPSPASRSPSSLLRATADTEIMGVKELLATARWLWRLCWRAARHPGEGCAGWFAPVLFQPWGFPGAAWWGWAGLILWPCSEFFWLHKEFCVCGCNPEKYWVENALNGCCWSLEARAVLLSVSTPPARCVEGRWGHQAGIYLPGGTCITHWCSRRGAKAGCTAVGDAVWGRSALACVCGYLTWGQH